jgi:hypothetical protein
MELDIWEDGAEIVVYHGYTLTSKILFSHVLRIVKVGNMLLFACHSRNATFSVSDLKSTKFSS